MIPSHAGGCIFAPDLHLNAFDAGPIFWRPEHLADIVCLVPERGPATHPSRIIFDPWSWRATAHIARAVDGIHILLLRHTRDHIRLWMPRRRALPRIGSRLAVHIHPDGFARERAEAAIRFWRIASEPYSSPPPLPSRWPQRNHVRMTAMLVAHDLSMAGLGQRAQARLVLGADPGRDWASSFERSALRRLHAEARALIAGGYLGLLRPPKRQGRA